MTKDATKKRSSHLKNFRYNKLITTLFYALKNVLFLLTFVIIFVELRKLKQYC